MKLSEVPDGSRVRVVLEGTIKHFETIAGPATRLGLSVGGGLTFARGIGTQVDAEILTPAWREGDVVSYAGATFVRDTRGKWHGSNRWAAFDDEITSRHELGQVTHLLRDGKAVR